MGHEDNTLETYSTQTAIYQVKPTFVILKQLSAT